MYFLERELLQIISGTREVFSKSLTSDNWKQLYDFSLKHSIPALSFSYLEKQNVKETIDTGLLFNWIGVTSQIEGRNRLMNERSKEITSFLRDLGYNSIIIKGQANNLYYPYKDKRSSGDIDVWVIGERKEIIERVRKRSNLSRIQFLHVDFRYFKDVEVEIHFSPGILYNYYANKRLQLFFKKYRSNYNTCIYGFNYLLNVPNYIMQVAHLYRHLFTGGFGFRHLFDLLFLIKSSNYSREEKRLIINTLESCKLLTFSKSVMYILHKIFGLEESYLIGGIDSKKGEFLLQDVYSGGNFGSYNVKYGNKSKYINNKTMNFLYSTYQSSRLVAYYPNDFFWFVVYRISQFFWRLKNGYR